MKRRITRGISLVLIVCMILTLACAAGSGGIQIFNEDGADITGQTLTMNAGDRQTVFYSLDAVVAELIQTAENGSYDLKATMSWTTTNTCVVSILESDESFGFNYGYATELVANAAGTATILAQAQITFTTGQNEPVTYMQSASFQVEIEGPEQGTGTAADDTYPHNPFRNIDLSKVENPFSDVSPNAWYYQYVMYLYAAGMYDGLDFGGGAIYAPELLSVSSAEPSYQLSLLSNTSSAPKVQLLSSGKKPLNSSNKECRGYTVTYLYNGHKSIGGTVSSYTKNIFTDVASGVSYYQPVLWASANSVVNGYGNGLFGPLDGVTREQFCAILLRYANYAGITLPADQAAATFTDGSKISSWAKDAVVACQKAGIINGYPDGTFRPKDGITRAEVSKMIYAFYNAIP